MVLIEERGDGAPADLLAKSLEAGVDKAANLVSQAVGATPETGAGAAGRAPSGGFRVGVAPGGSKEKRQRTVGTVSEVSVTLCVRLRVCGTVAAGARDGTATVTANARRSSEQRT